MATNRHAMIRYQALDRCFRNHGRTYTINDLLENCNDALMEFDPNSVGIKKRQLYDDIRYMESSQGWSIPLVRVKDGRKACYRYEDASFSINDSPLNDSEINQLQSVIDIISRFSGLPQFEWVEEIIPKLETKFGLSAKGANCISFDSNIDLVGLNHLGPLFNAIVSKRVLSLTYQPYNGDVMNFNFHPYFLKQYNNRWFVFGLHEEFKISEWNLALDRIVKFEETALKYIETEIDWEDYFYDIIGVSRPYDAELVEVKLLFSSETAPYVVSKPIHASQKHKVTEEGLEVRIKVIPNYELEQVILSYGGNVKVLSPDEVKRKIINRIGVIKKLYLVEFK